MSRRLPLIAAAVVLALAAYVWAQVLGVEAVGVVILAVLMYAGTRSLGMPRRGR